MEPLIHKYHPKSTKDILGQDEALEGLKDFIGNYSKQKKKAALVYGPTGTGKSSSVYTIADETDLEVIEVNASDIRNKAEIMSKLGNATSQQSLFSKGKIILVDEIDGLSGTKDRGGLGAVLNIVKKSKFPIILTVGNPWDNKFSSLRNKARMIEFKELKHTDIFRIIKKICNNEKIEYDEDTLKIIARRAGGDARAAINDIQISGSNRKITEQDLDVLSEREKEDTIINGLIKIFKTKDPKIAIGAFDHVKEDVNDQMLWLDENLPKEYEKKEDLARAYDKMSKADIFNRRIRRWQHWRFLVYINALLTAGIAVSKDEKYKKMTEYKPTGRILKLWWAKQKSMKKKSIASKVAQFTHSSTKEVVQDFELLKSIFMNNKEMSAKIIDDLELEKEEIEFMRK